MFDLLNALSVYTPSQLPTSISGSTPDAHLTTTPTAAKPTRDTVTLSLGVRVTIKWTLLKRSEAIVHAYC